MLSVFLITHSAEERGRVKLALADLAEHELVGEASSLAEGELLLGESGASVAIVRYSLPDGSGLDLIQRMHARRPRMEFVLLLSGEEPAEAWQRIIQAGLRHVISPPIDPASVRRALAAAMQPPSAKNSAAAPPNGDGGILAVVSARGGVGKTLLAANLAAALTRRHERASLIDFSGQPGDLCTLLHETPGRTLIDLLGTPGDIEPEFLEVLLPEHPCGLRYLATPGEHFNAAELTRPLVRNVLRQMRAVSDAVVVDTGAGESVVTQAVVLEADVTLVVTSRDLVRLTATRRYLRQLADWEVPPAAVRVVVNEAQTGAEVSDSQIESILEHPVAAYLPADPDAAARSINTGRLLTVGPESSALGAALNKLAPLIWSQWMRHGVEAA
jgi:pilus assembly protein CpaE